jgi:hypothetical protein
MDMIDIIMDATHLPLLDFFLVATILAVFLAAIEKITAYLKKTEPQPSDKKMITTVALIVSLFISNGRRARRELELDMQRYAHKDYDSNPPNTAPHRQLSRPSHDAKHPSATKPTKFRNHPH